MPSKKIGRYQIIKKIGEGGMGKVYRAKDPALNREVVLKLIRLPETRLDDERRQRFKREVQAAGQLNHPHIVTVYDVNLEHDPPYVVMELLSGHTLQERLQTAPLPWHEALLLLRPLAEALAYAHRVGVIHRDVKPANVMFGGDDGSALKLVDFGLARWRQSSEQMTQVGTVLGTPAYMSPEQAEGELVDARADIFALGIIMFEAIAGYNPLDKETFVSTLRETMSDNELDLTPLVDQAAPPEVVSLIKKAIAKNRDRRYNACEELLADLNRCLDKSVIVSSDHLTVQLPPGPAIGGPEILVAANIALTDEVKAVLRSMFAAFRRVAVETEFGDGFGGSRVFRVRPVEGEDRTHLPAVVKIAPIGLIRQEWEAYQSWVEHTLPNIARLVDPLLPAGGLWGGLRYALVGAGSFEIKSLRDYYQTATIEDLCWVLEKRLFEIMGPNWWWDSRADRTFQMQMDYDSLLPPNLLVKPGVGESAKDAHLITAGNFTWPALAAGDQVCLQGLLVIKVDAQANEVTLNLPAARSGRPSASFRVRLVEAPDVGQYRTGNVIGSICGQVTATRRDLLAGLAGQTIGASLDLTAEQLDLTADRPMPLPLLPNPLWTYQNSLQNFLTVKIAKVHGDLNMANILIDSETREVNLIDFATVRQGHALHDLLRLETEIVIMLMPAAFAEAGLPATAIYPIYEQLHQIALAPERKIRPRLPAATLEKPFALLRAIRKMARTCLFNLNDWGEYYQGLSLYLLGALKFDSLDALPSAPLPKQIAFLGAATAQYLQEVPLPEVVTPSSGPSPPGPTPIDEDTVALEPPFGAVRPTSKMYIERQADDHCLVQISQSYATTLFIKASRQMGKTSLLHRALYRVNREQRKPSAFIDFQEFPHQHFDDEQAFLIQFCLSISNDLGIPPAIDQYWQGPQTDSLKCRTYMSEYIIPQVNAPLILALDELDRVLSSPFRDDFFGMLRAWHNYRARNENFAKLSLLLSSSTEPYLFIDNPNQSPFNVAEIISLQDFSRAEVDDLNQRHRSPLDPPQIDALMELVAGHPFLTRLALYQVASSKFDWPTLLAQATADNGPFGDHLRRYLSLVGSMPELKPALIDISRSQRCADDLSFYRLQGTGLVKQVGQQIVFRNQLYSRYFKEHFNA